MDHKHTVKLRRQYFFFLEKTQITSSIPQPSLDLGIPWFQFQRIEKRIASALVVLMTDKMQLMIMNNSHKQNPKSQGNCASYYPTLSDIRALLCLYMAFGHSGRIFLHSRASSRASKGLPKLSQQKLLFEKKFASLGSSSIACTSRKILTSLVRKSQEINERSMHIVAHGDILIFSTQCFDEPGFCSESQQSKKTVQ